MTNAGKRIALALVAGASLLGAAATAGEGEWKLKLGASYRVFDDFEFGAAALPGSLTSADPAGPFGIQDLVPLQPGFAAPAPAYDVILDVVTASGADIEAEDSSLFAPYFGAEYGLSDDGDVSTALTIGFQYFTPEGDAAGNAAGITSVATVFTVVDDGGTPKITPTGIPVGAGVPVTASQDWEVDLAVLDLGLKGAYDAGGFTFGIEGGPTLNFIDVESSQSFDTSAVAAVPAGVTNGTAMPPTSDDDSEVSLGLYFGLNVAYAVSDDFGIGLGYRYDWVDDDAETVHGSMDLSSHSFMLTFEVGF